MTDLTHLHVHSHYSLLDGLHTPEVLAQRARELGMSALAITDHGAMYGVVEFYQACHEQGIKPILGMEVYIARRKMTDREAGQDTKPHHLVLLAENEVGYRNLREIATAAQLEGFYYKPRVDKDFLAKHAAGLIALSSCRSGEVPRYLGDGLRDKAKQAAVWHKEVFGDRYYLELQSHAGIPELTSINRELIALGKELDIPLVATNDVHYLTPADADAHALLLCIQTSTTIRDPKRMQMGSPDYHLRSADEMAALFAEIPEAIANTRAVAERCHLDLGVGKYHLPDFQVPEGFTPQSYLAHIAQQGLPQRYALVTPEIQARLDYELGIIHDMGFDTYFLIVWDLVQAAKRMDIWWNIRGSAAGSMVAYCLGLTNLDPLAHDLIFERFLNPGRVTMPDVDLDFPDDRRDEMIRYAVDKYGQDHVAQIITFGTMAARAAIRDVGRALDIPLLEVDRVAKLAPSGPKADLKEALQQSPELRAVYENTGEWANKSYLRDLLDMALHLEGVARHASTHAAGVVIADKPLIEYLPLHRPTKEGQGGIVTQYAMEDLEKIGLLKMDFLGLSTLTIMRRTLDLIRETRGVTLSLDKIPLDDPEIYKLLSSGNVEGVFQVESAGMRRVLTGLQPTRFEDIVAVISLYRPGPMQFIDSYIARKHGREKVEYVHPRLEPILRETYGIMVYQEQVIRVCTDLAGYTAVEADLMRRAVGKKKEEELLAHRDKFVGGAAGRGIPRDIATKIFDDITYFANYGFNKAHAADYAVITCQTAYLKAHYPVEYMAALLSVERGNQEKVALYVNECGRLGIAVLPPDVNRSRLDFAIESQVPSPKSQVSSAHSDVRRETWDVGRETWDARREMGLAIRFGLGAIKNVGEGAVEAIVAAREKGGPFANLDDFCARVDLRQVNRRALECLIQVGALDAFGRREQLLPLVERMMDASQRAHYAQEVGQLSLFGSGAQSFAHYFGALPSVPPLGMKEYLRWEQELVGLYLSEHPLKRILSNLKESVTATCDQIDESLAGQVVVIAGMVTNVRTITTKKGEPMAFARLEDLHGSVEVVVFPKVYAKTAALWHMDTTILLRAQVELREGKLQLIAQTVTQMTEESPPPPSGQGLTKKVPRRHLNVSVVRSGDLEKDKQLLGMVYRLLEKYPGEDTFSLILGNGPHGEGRVALDFPNAKTHYCVALQEELQGVLGANCVQVRTAAQ